MSGEQHRSTTIGSDNPTGVRSMGERIPALEQRVAHLEATLTNGFSRLEEILRQQISDLKNEQLRDIKATIDRVERDGKIAHERLADDQRRLWDAVRALENDRSQRGGAVSVWHGLAHAVTAMLSGAVGAALAWFLGRPHG